MSKPLTDKQKKLIRSKLGKSTAEQLAKELKVDLDQVEAFLITLKRPLDPRTKRIFTAILVAVPFVFIILLELGLRLFGYGGNLSLFLPASEEVSDYYLINRDVGKRYFFMQNTIPRPTKDLFLREKSKNSYRIFVLGGSTTAGFPYGNNLTFSRILDHRLHDTFPDLRVEVVNVAMSAISSYTLIDFMDEILARKPDAILIYAGHNEFYGAMGVGSMESLGRNPAITRAYLKLKKFRLFLLMRDVVGSIRKATTKAVHGAAENDPTATLMERIVAEQTIPLDSPLYNKGKAQFRANLATLLSSARQAEVPVLISELVSNVRDQRPFVSQKTDKHPAASSVYTQAQTLERSGQPEEAKSVYYNAKDLDALRFRATEEFNTIIHEIAHENQIPVVPMKTYFEQASGNGLIGDLLMTDHLHPNMTGYFLMAEAFYRTMRQYRMIAGVWPKAEPPPLSETMRNWGVTRLDTLYAELGIRFLKGGWPFQPKSRPNHTLDDFIPQNEAESMAVEAITDPDFGIETAHLKLAEYYQKNGETGKALKEYKALYHTIPYETMFYERAAEILIGQKRYAETIPLLEASLKVRETYFAQKWLGQLLLAQNDMYGAIPHLERAMQLQKPDEQLLYNLVRSYLKISNPDAAEPVAARLAALYPDSRFLPVLKSLQAESQADFAKVNDLLKEAQGCLQSKDYDKAEPLLLKALQIQENRTANEWLAQLYVAKKEVEKAIPFFEKVLCYTPDDPDRLYPLAVMYTRIGRPFKARDLLVHLEKIKPDFEDSFNLRSLFEKAK